MKKSDPRNLMLGQAMLCAANAMNAENLYTFKRLSAINPVHYSLAQTYDVLGLIGALYHSGISLTDDMARDYLGRCAIITGEGDPHYFSFVDIVDEFVGDDENMGEDEDVLNLRAINDCIAESIYEVFVKDVSSLEIEDIQDAFRRNDARIMSELGEILFAATDAPNWLDQFMRLVSEVQYACITNTQQTEGPLPIGSASPDDMESEKIQQILIMPTCEYSLESLSKILQRLLPILLATVGMNVEGLVPFLERIQFLRIVKCYCAYAKSYYSGMCGKIGSEDDLYSELSKNPKHFFTTIDTYRDSRENFECVAAKLYHDFFEPVEPLNADVRGAIIASGSLEELFAATIEMIGRLFGLGSGGYEEDEEEEGE